MVALKTRLRSLTGLTSVFNAKRTHEEVQGNREEAKEVNIIRLAHDEPAASIFASVTLSSPPPMFNELHNVSIHGGTFIQNNSTGSDGHIGFKLLQQHVAASAFHNSSHRLDPSTCHPSTRVAILQLISDWIDGRSRNEHRILWLNGAAGAGKSAIMQTIAERYTQTAVALASFFFFRADSTRNTIAPLVATLAYQLIQAIPETAESIFLTIEQNPLIFDQSLDAQLHHLIILPILRLPTHLRRLFVVVIDGLDECNDRAHQSNLIKVLNNISSSRTLPILFLIASRLEPQIEMALGQQPANDLVHMISLDDTQASDDIRRFLYAKFDEIKATHPSRTFLPVDWPAPVVVEQIVDKSSGQFIYASVVVNYISSPHTHPAFQLDIVTGLCPTPASADNPFSQLDALYSHIFSQVKNIDIVFDILALNLLTHNSSTYQDGGGEVGMRLQRLDALFQLAPGELEVYLSGLTAVIRCDQRRRDKATMKFLHASLPDFLLDKRRSRDYFIDLDVYATKLLCLFIDLPPTPLVMNLGPSPTHKREALSVHTSSRIFAIRTLLKRVKASDHLRRVLMEFRFEAHDGHMFHVVYECCLKMLKFLKQMNFNDAGQVYLHILDVFTMEFAKYWPSDDDGLQRLARWDIPELLTRIGHIRAQG